MQCTRSMILLAVAMAATPCAADTHVILAWDVSFVPAAITAAPGDTITWEYASGYPHTVTSGSDCLPDGLFDAPLNGGNPTFTWVVPDDAAGLIPYFCQPHCAMDMTGVITIDEGPSTIQVPGDYPTVQDAVGVAVSGDSILIAAGSYDVDTVLYLEGVSLIGESHVDGTPAVTLNFVDWNPAFGNWGLFCTPSAAGDEVQLQHLHVRDAITSLEIQGCSPTVTNCVFQDGQGHPQKYDSGGAQIRDSAATFIGCSFIGNSARYGGAFQAYNPAVSDPLTLTDCTFEGNHATYDGGAMSLHTCVVVMNGCSVIGNTATDESGGLDIHSSCDVALVDTTVCGNTPNQITGDWTDNGGNSVADECASECPGDLDGNGAVNVDDLLSLLSAYQQSNDGDCDGDGDTDVDDLLLLISAWGECP